MRRVINDNHFSTMSIDFYLEEQREDGSRRGINSPVTIFNILPSNILTHSSLNRVREEELAEMKTEGNITDDDERIMSCVTRPEENT